MKKPILRRLLIWVATILIVGIGVNIVIPSTVSLPESRNLIKIIIFLSVGIVTFVVAYFYEKSDLQPLRRLIQVIYRLNEGEVETIVPSDRDDEVGQLEQSLNRVILKLNNKIANLLIEQGKLDALVNQMSDGVIIVDGSGKILLMNLAAKTIFGFQKIQSETLTLAEAVRNHQIVTLWEKCKDTHEQQVLTLETTPQRLFIQAIATPLLQHIPDQILITIQDLTRIRRLEAVRRDFVSNVSHELRTPLASLKTLIETLEAGALEDPPAAKRFFERMNTEVDSMTQMVQELLELSKIESGKVPLELNPTLPWEIIRPGVERMQLQVDRAGLKLNVKDEIKELPEVLADKARMQQVVMNLLHNAIKYTPPGGTINIWAEIEGSMMKFEIRDTGVGINPENLERIFERFYKADRARSGGGTGLGLSIARHLVEAHGGRIWADSTLSEGSIFYFTLPLYKINKAKNQ